MNTSPKRIRNIDCNQNIRYQYKIKGVFKEGVGSAFAIFHPKTRSDQIFKDGNV